MIEYGLDLLVERALAFEFDSREIATLKYTYNKACDNYVRDNPKPVNAGIPQYLNYMEAKFMFAFKESSKYIGKVLDEHQKEGDEIK